MEDNELINRALAHATRAHADQTDKRGRPYIQHVTEVAAAVQEHGRDAIITALLHDLLEDTTDTNLSAYPPQAQEAIRTITRQENEAYDDYIQRVAKNPLARLGKLADLRLNHATCPDPTLKARYAKAIARLEQEPVQG